MFWSRVFSLGVIIVFLGIAARPAVAGGEDEECDVSNTRSFSESLRNPRSEEEFEHLVQLSEKWFEQYEKDRDTLEILTRKFAKDYFFEDSRPNGILSGLDNSEPTQGLDAARATKDWLRWSKNKGLEAMQTVSCENLFFVQAEQKNKYPLYFVCYADGQSSLLAAYRRRNACSWEAIE